MTQVSRSALDESCLPVWHIQWLSLTFIARVTTSFTLLEAIAIHMEITTQ